MIRTFLIEGVPHGLRTMELSNSTILATLFPRPSLARFLARPAAKRPGVYVLLGPDPGDEVIGRIYVGEGDPVGPRLQDHGVKKDFWTQAVAFTSKDDYLTKTQIQFLEAELVATAKAVARVTLDNENTPGRPAISEADAAEMDDFLEKVKLLVGAAGFDFLTSRVAVPSSAMPAAGQGEVFRYSIKEATARMVRTASAYVVTKGSTAILEQPDYGTKQRSVTKSRAQLLKSGILAPSASGALQFTEDAQFESPSAAAAAVAGGGQNGRICWKRESDGKTLREVEEEEAASSR